MGEWFKKKGEANTFITKHGFITFDKDSGLAYVTNENIARELVKCGYTRVSTETKEEPTTPAPKSTKTTIGNKKQ